MSVIPTVNGAQGADALEMLRGADLGAQWHSLLAEIDTLTPAMRRAVLERILIDCATRSTGKGNAQ